ncbi:hypothetical protein RJ639_032113 [Escallonia herrerae]|uniref:RNase H type-1 domain-containing protein n=1 Tax=Escallonia herrerae TaxID=1293975 RepID=A0AA88X6P0_9ASTE|nr:hypothetical protein RJ639_032113 [Escallonia herrerae]
MAVVLPSTHNSHLDPSDLHLRLTSRSSYGNKYRSTTDPTFDPKEKSGEHMTRSGSCYHRDPSVKDSTNSSPEQARNFDVKRALVDNGSSVEVLFYDAFNKMNILMDRLWKMDTPLYGFSNQPVAVKGIITLPVAIDTPPTQANFMLDFMVERSPLHTMAYWDDQTRKHSLSKTSEKIPRYKGGKPVEDLVSIEVYPGEENKTVRIGLNLKEDTKVKLVNLLRTYADVFAWTAADMSGIDPKIISHRKALLSPEASRRLVNWSVELGEFDIQYKPRTTIKAQALADFIIECTSPKDPPPLVISKVSNPWNLYIDDSLAIGSSGARIILISPEGFVVEYALRFEFQASNNKAEYEALLAGISLVHALKVDSLSGHSDSQLVVNHVLGNYEARDERMAQYLQLVKTSASKFKNFTIRQIPRDQNTQADTLSRHTSAKVTDVRCSIYLEFLKDHSIISQTEIAMIDQERC